MPDKKDDKKPEVKVQDLSPKKDAKGGGRGADSRGADGRGADGRGADGLGADGRNLEGSGAN